MMACASPRTEDLPADERSREEETTVKHLLTAADLSRDEATAILDDADRFANALVGREVKKLPTLRGRTVITMFYENSTRTRVSFEVAGKWMSADVINVSASSSSVSKGESLRDTALTLRAAGADALIIRHPASGAAQQLAQWTAEDSAVGLPLGAGAQRLGGGPSVINAGDGTHEHPTQALLDALTLRQRLGDIEGRRVVIVGDILHSRVARSNVELLATLGAEVVLVAPPTLLPVGVTSWPVTVSHDLDAELPAADAVLMLRVQAERMTGGFFPSAREYSVLYGLSEKRQAILPEHAVVLHPGPMLRGMEIASSVADSSQSAVLQQVSNGVHVRMAVLFHLLVGAAEPVGTGPGLGGAA
jgi:aspartate carbamoyltransferase catalytic subunit